jgi:hypothetical protein
MAAKFPTEIDTLVRNSLGEAIEAVERKVGVDGDAAGTLSVEGRLKTLEGGGGGGGVPSTRLVATDGSLVGGGDLSADRTIQLSGDSVSPGINKVYGTDGAGAKGWKADPAGGGVPTTRQVATAGSITGGGDLSADRTLQLSGDAASPGNNQVYGTNGSGVKGWKADPAGGGGLTAAQVMSRSI